MINEFQTKTTNEIKVYYSEPLAASSNNDQSAYPSLNEAYTAPAVADGTTAIPLPPPNNIPEPPATKVPFIGPSLPPNHGSNQQSANAAPSSEEQMKKVNDLLATMKGHVEHEILNDSIFDDREVARIIGCSP